jgi:PAS domain S-box-containing protein
MRFGKGPAPATPDYGGSFCAALNEMGVGAAEVSADGAWLAVNAQFCDIVGMAADELHTTSASDLLRVETTGLVAGTAAARTSDSALRKRDGNTAWIRSTVAPVRDPSTGQVGSLLVLVADVTPLKALDQPFGTAGHPSRGRREVGGRLINALEAERSRIARELHDDIGQSLAVLVVQMLRAGKPVSGSAGRRHADARELAGQLQEIVSRVGRLSHELHSSKLEYLGLEKAVRGACTDFAKGQPLAVEFTCEAVPAELDSGIGLCVLRVVQEALHNAAKHSRGSEVKVRLAGDERGLTVVIEDNGVGFDVAEASLAEGIGLISMRERVSFVGGSLYVASAPGRGTRIEARVPVVPVAG